MKSILQIYNIKTAERRVVKVFDYHIEAPNWTMDGKNLVYNSNGYIYLFNLESKESTLIDTGRCTSCNNDHVLSSDGKQIAISSGTDDFGASRIWILPLEGGEPRLVTEMTPSYLHGWSPDGKTLAYCAERNGNYDIYIIPAEGGEEVRLTTAEGLDDGPEYSPDGKYIWFNSVRSGLMQIWRMKNDGTEQTQMTDDEFNNWFPHISPDGEKVVFISYYKDQVQPGDHPANKDVKIRLMSANGGKVETLMDLFGGQGTMNVNSWNPNSEEFAFVSYEL
ncbi:TolB family protein [Clostridium thermarum]|uniref:TolB family protein n=1 Tax=Clostridium thermarum TaxID=1716543 RepID=UPI0011221E98|nr:TolB family protein [Clostridium thermarum]